MSAITRLGAGGYPVAAITPAAPLPQTQNVPIRPTNVNFYGFFQSPGVTGGGAASFTFPWESFSLSFFTNQIDAAKGVGANTFFLFGSVLWSTDGSGITLNTYLSRVKQVFNYLQSHGMYFLMYSSEISGSNFGGSDWTDITNAQVCTILSALAPVCAEYPNCIGFITMDEPFAGQNASPALVSLLAAQYSASRAALPLDIGVTACPNPCGNFSGATVWDYSGQGKINLDTVVPYCDFFAFHPFYQAALSDTSALRAAFPSKQIIMPSSVAQTVDATAAADCTAIMNLVGANNFRGMGVWNVIDYPTSGTVGFFNSDFTLRTTRTNAFTAGLSGGSPQKMRRTFPGNPRLNQYLRWQYAA